jgi:ketosteroid isomerase-like protein
MNPVVRAGETAMIARTPSSAIQMADEAFNRGDLEGMLVFYEEGATMLFRPNEVLTGKAAIRRAIGQLLAMKMVARHEKTHIIEQGDIALWGSNWSVTGTAPDGSPIARRGTNSVILRRGADGGWRVAIENPWAAVILDSDATTQLGSS